MIFERDRVPKWGRLRETTPIVLKSFLLYLSTSSDVQVLVPLLFLVIFRN